MTHQPGQKNRAIGNREDKYLSKSKPKPKSNSISQAAEQGFLFTNIPESDCAR
jgi:hypothetical protein